MKERNYLRRFAMSEVEKLLLNMLAFSAWNFAIESQQSIVRAMLEKLDDSSEMKQIVSQYFIE
jgi:hypothetical protein